MLKEGTGPAPIVLPEKPTLFTSLAAEDLALYLEKITGAKPQILEGLPDPVPERAIWVGYQPKLKEIFPDADFDFKQPEEILIKAKNGHLALVGRDRWDPDNMKISQEGFQFGNRHVEGFQFEYGTVNAVYTFLQKYLGVRWLWPGEGGDVVPKRDALAFEPFEYRYHPVMRQRHSIFGPLALFKQGGKPGNPAGDWVRRQRLQLDSLYAPASGHGFGDWFDRYGKEHPEYFALKPDGSRSGSERNPRGAKICESNPAVWEQWLRDVEETLKKYPHRRVFNAAANDGYASDHCTCEGCRAWDSPDAELRRFIYGPERLELPALSDRQVNFANTLGRELKKRYPDKDYKVLILAYGFSRPAPIKAVPDDNVIIANVANVFSVQDGVEKDSLIGTKAMKYFDDWAKLTPNQIWRPNTGDPVRWRSGGPPDITGGGGVFQHIAKQGVLGVTIDMIWFHWATQGPLYYLLGQLAWDPNQPMDEILKDYYQSGFGSAAAEVEAYYGLLEQNRKSIQKGGTSWAEGFDSTFFDRAEELLNIARGKAEKAGGEYAERVDFVRAGLDYLRLNTANQELAQKIIASKSPLPEAVEAMRANWQQIEEIAAKHPHAFNRAQVSSRGASNRMNYIHPDADHKALHAEQQRRAKRRPAAHVQSPVDPDDLD